MKKTSSSLIVVVVTLSTIFFSSCVESTPTIALCGGKSVENWFEESIAIMDDFDDSSKSKTRECYTKQLDVYTPECLNGLQILALNFYDYAEERLLAIEDGDYDLASHYVEKMAEALASLHVGTTLLEIKHGWK